MTKVFDSYYQIIACPHCNCLYKNQIVVHHDTSLARHFSDGPHVDPVVPNFVDMVKCANKNCRKFFCIDRATKIGVSNDNNRNLIPKKRKTALYAYKHKIRFKELEEALERDFVGNGEDEIQMRIVLLRRHNDVVRYDRRATFSSNEREAVIRNIERLIQIVSLDTTMDKLILAELYREKNDFDRCLEILNRVSNENENEKWFKEQIFSQAKVKDDKVFDVCSVAIKKEYKCNTCGHSAILFDLERMGERTSRYKHYRCKDDATLFNSPLTLEKLSEVKCPDGSIITFPLVCPTCNGNNVEAFNPETDNCINCGKGTYARVKWF